MQVAAEKLNRPWCQPRPAPPPSRRPHPCTTLQAGGGRGGRGQAANWREHSVLLVETSTQVAAFRWGTAITGRLTLRLPTGSGSLASRPCCLQLSEQAMHVASEHSDGRQREVGGRHIVCARPQLPACLRLHTRCPQPPRRRRRMALPAKWGTRARGCRWPRLSPKWLRDQGKAARSTRVWL